MKKIISVLVVLILSIPLLSIEKLKWIKSGTTWDFQESKVTTRSPNASPWEFYELSNLNSIISLESFQSISDINIIANIFDKEKTPSEVMLSFSVTSESKSWFYHIYAFKLSGGFWGINKASFIYSDRLDKSKPLNTKNNIFVKEIVSADCKVKYDKMYSYRIAFEGSDVILYINDQKILAAPFPEKSHDGHIAISARNVKISVDKVEVKQGDKVIFEDDFNEDSILIKYLKVTREPLPKKDNAKKPE